jgi:sec-independent protein translocase protein TatA
LILKHLFSTIFAQNSGKMMMLASTLLFIQGKEWIVILLAVVLLFGGKKIPELMRGIGQGVREFKDASKGDSKEDNKPEKV